MSKLSPTLGASSGTGQGNEKVTVSWTNESGMAQRMSI